MMTNQPYRFMQPEYRASTAACSLMIARLSLVGWIVLTAAGLAIASVL